MKKFLSSVFGTAVVSAVLTLLPTAGAFAITISPPTFDHNLNPGDAQLDVITVINEESNPITLYPTLYNFTAVEGDESGLPQLYPATENRDGMALAPWITIDKTAFTLQPGERKNLPFTINVPGKDQAQPGGHYGVVIFGTSAPDPSGATQVAVDTQLGALVLVNVSGDVKEQASIAEFGFEKKVKFYTARPIDMYVRIENSGNTHLRPTGNVFVKNWFGKNVAQPQVNADFKSVLPHTIRKFGVSWAGKNANEPKKGFFKKAMYEWDNFAIGKYTVEAYVNYGKDNQILTAKREFSVWPWHLMLLILLALILAITLFILYKKNYDKAVIRRYERMNKR